jgi:hypothetical protein
MKVLLISLSLAWFAAPARADVFEDYRSLATSLGERTRSGVAVDGIQADHATLLGLGVEIMDLYGEANPKCAAQFAQIETELPDVDKLSFEEIFRRYHSAQGLPAGPRHCYFGRGLVGHLLMTTARFRDGLTDAERSAAAADYDEVAEHITQAKENIENPPN